MLLDFTNKEKIILEVVSIMRNSSKDGNLVLYGTAIGLKGAIPTNETKKEAV